MATPITIYYVSEKNATKSDVRKSLTPSYIDGIAQDALNGITGTLDSIEDWVLKQFEEPPVPPKTEAEKFLTKGTYGDLQYNPIGEGDFSGIAVENTPVVNTLSFHGVIGETHSAQTEITKFPTQAGFEISNHAIRKNRTVEVEAIISNTLLNAVGSRQVNYGLDNSVIVFEALEALINSATVCTVSTNLGLYWPVVFTKFRTKQELGTVDSLKFTLHGEEVLIQETLNKTAPKQLVFTRITGSQCDILASEKARDGFLFQCNCNSAISSTLDKIYGVNPGITAGLGALSVSTFSASTAKSTFIQNASVVNSLLNKTAISNNAIQNSDLSEDSSQIQSELQNVFSLDHNLGRDFIVDGTDTAGKPYQVTYKALHYDYTLRKHKYEVHSNDTDVYIPDEAAQAAQAGTQEFSILPDVSTDAILGASRSVSNCLLLGAGDLACQAGQDLIDTGMGKMRETIYGVITDVVNMGGIDGSDSLLGMSLDCVSNQVYGEGVGFEEGGDILANDIDNATNRILSGATEYGSTKSQALGGLLRKGAEDSGLAGIFEKPSKMTRVDMPIDGWTGA